MSSRPASTWLGIGIISPKGLFLEAIGAHSDFILRKLKECPKGSRLVRVEAVLKPLTKAAYRKAGRLKYGFRPKRISKENGDKSARRRTTVARTGK